jgi:hypothetical protein
MGLACSFFVAFSLQVCYSQRVGGAFACFGQICKGRSVQVTIKELQGLDLCPPRFNKPHLTVVCMSLVILLRE